MASTSENRIFFLKNYSIVFIANSLIATLLSILDFNPDLARWFREIAINFIFSQSIGSSIFLFACLSNFDKTRSLLLRFVVLIGIFVLAGWAGAIIAWGLSALLFNFNLPSNYLLVFFLRLAIFNVFVSTVVYSYLVLREKLQDTASRLAEKEISEQRLLRLKTKAELEALRAKVNPHFLFNTLNSIASLIPLNPEKAEQMVQKLSHIFRYTLDASSHEMMKLSDELAVIREYLEIEKVRLGDRLTYEIELEEVLDDVLLPSMILQPLVENSVKHGIAPHKSGGHISLKCERKDGLCQVEIHDSGEGFNGARVEEGFGLTGVKERLALYYGEDVEFQISNDGGAHIRIRFPRSGS